jgi:hypothetical protein
MLKQLELVTLNRTLAVMVGGEVEKVSAFVGAWSRNITVSEDSEYLVHEICLPKKIVLTSKVRISFKKSAIISTQEVPCEKR